MLRCILICCPDGKIDDGSETVLAKVNIDELPLTGKLLTFRLAALFYKPTFWKVLEVSQIISTVLSGDENYEDAYSYFNVYIQPVGITKELIKVFN